MPDLERRSSASFISSNEGGTPDSFRRSLMKRSSSNCLRVNILDLSQSPGPRCAETNHERTLYVPYVFRNPLISREQVERPLKRRRKPKDDTTLAGLNRWGKRLANDEAIGLCERRHHRGVLHRDRRRHGGSIRAGRKRRPHVVGPLVV